MSHRIPIYRRMLGVLLLAAGCGRSSRPDSDAPHGAQASPIRESTRGWRAATFRGLKVGASTRADVVRRLGEPRGRTRVEESGPESVRVFEYGGIGELGGRVDIRIDSARGVVVGVTEYPDSLPLGGVLHHFGEGYVQTRYSGDECRGDGESVPMYEDRDGPLAFVEYRARGIAIPVDSPAVVHEIYYRDGTPLGAASAATCDKPSAF